MQAGGLDWTKTLKDGNSDYTRLSAPTYNDCIWDLWYIVDIACHTHKTIWQNDVLENANVFRCINIENALWKYNFSHVISSSKISRHATTSTELQWHEWTTSANIVSIYLNRITMQASLYDVCKASNWQNVLIWQNHPTFGCNPTHWLKIIPKHNRSREKTTTWHRN